MDAISGVNPAFERALGQQSLADVTGIRGQSPESAGKHFESMFATMLVREMRSGLDEGFFGSGPGASTFSSWLDEHVGRVIAERGALGTGALVERFAAQVGEANSDIEPTETAEDAR